MHNTFLVDFCNRSCSKFYGWVCNLTRWCKYCGKSCSYKNRASGNVPKVRGSLFLASILHQNFLIAKDLQIKSLAIFFLYPLQLQALTAFLRRAGDCCSLRWTIPATAFCTTFSAKVSETQGRKSLEHYCLLSTISKNWYSEDLVYQIDGAKVGFSPLLLRLLICQVLVLICLFAYFADASCRIYYLLFWAENRLHD